MGPDGTGSNLKDRIRSVLEDREQLRDDAEEVTEKPTTDGAAKGEKEKAEGATIEKEEEIPKADVKGESANSKEGDGQAKSRI